MKLYGAYFEAQCGCEREAPLSYLFIIKRQV